MKRILIYILLLICIFMVVCHYNPGFLYHSVVQPSLTKFYGHSQKYLSDHFFDIYPNFEYITHPVSRKLNISKEALYEYTTFSALSLKKRLQNFEDDMCAIDELLDNCVPNIHLDGKKVDLSSCLVIDIFLAKKGAFPIIHTDIEWKHFPTDGFQLWYLLENDSYEHGNMFLFDMPMSTKKYEQTNLLYEPPNRFKVHVKGKLCGELGKKT